MKKGNGTRVNVLFSIFSTMSNGEKNTKYLKN